MDVREKLVEIVERASVRTLPKNTCHTNIVMLVNALIEEGVTVQECIPVTDVPWLGEDISKLCIRYMTEYADFHGYASQKKVKAHIIRLLQAEADGRIAIMPQPPKGE